jgi:hypothetical protein
MRKSRSIWIFEAVPTLPTMYVNRRILVALAIAPPRGESLSLTPCMPCPSSSSKTNPIQISSHRLPLRGPTNTRNPYPFANNSSTALELRGNLSSFDSPNHTATWTESICWGAKNNLVLNVEGRTLLLLAKSFIWTCLAHGNNTSLSFLAKPTVIILYFL